MSRPYYRGSECAFGNLFMWQTCYDIFWTEAHGFLVLKVKRNEKAFPDLEITDDRDNWDYVYLQQNLATLAGRKYHGKKNHCNAFVKEHPDYVYEEMNRSNIEECLAFGDMPHVGRPFAGMRKMRYPRSA